MNEVFVHDQLIRFAHCDPAGIVFFPRFFDLAHNTMEDWFARGVGYSMPTMIVQHRVGTPTVALRTDFVKPLRIGETLRFSLTVTRMGNSSVDLRYVGSRGGDECLRILQTIVFMDLDRGKSIPIPADVRPRIEAFLNRDEGGT